MQLTNNQVEKIHVLFQGIVFLNRKLENNTIRKHHYMDFAFKSIELFKLDESRQISYGFKDLYDINKPMEVKPCN